MAEGCHAIFYIANKETYAAHQTAMTVPIFANY